MTLSTLEQYYARQAGGGSSTYHLLTPRQKGSGLGAVIGVGARMALPLIRAAAPYVKRGVIALTKEALNQGINVADDVLSGQTTLKKSVKRRAVQGGTNILRGRGASKKGTGPPPAKKSKTPKRVTKTQQGTVRRNARGNQGKRVQKASIKGRSTRAPVISKRTQQRTVGLFPTALSL